MKINISLLNIKKITSRIGTALVVGLLFLAILQLPLFSTSSGHDQGSQAAYAYWTLHRFAYGRDIIQNVGPLGFLSFPSIYTGFLDEPKLLINIFLTGISVLLLWNRSKILPVTIRTIALVLVGFFVVNDGTSSVMSYLLLLLTSHMLMFTPRRMGVLLATLVLAILALEKGTFLFISAFIIASTVISYALSRRFTTAITTVVGFGIFLLMLWMLAGQHPSYFPAFVYAMASFSSGYNEAMTLFESSVVQTAGFIAFVGSVLPIIWRAQNSFRNIHHDIRHLVSQLLLSATEFFILFVVWKHGFVRADGHAITFFSYVLVSHMWVLFRKELPCKVGDGSTLNVPLILAVPLAGIVISSSLVGINSLQPISPTSKFLSRYNRMESTLMGIVNIPILFGRLDSELKKNTTGMRLPRTKTLAGMQSIGYFGMFPAAMLYNELNFVSDPSTISFASWNDRIMKADAMFFGDDSRGPAYLLLDLKTIDNRLVAQDNSLAQLEIWHRYEFTGAEKGNLILHRIKDRNPLSRVPVSEHEYKVGDWLDVPQDSANPMWVKIGVDESSLARVVGLAYKPPQYFIEILFRNNATKIYKFIPQMAATGFLINPLIVDNSDVSVVQSPQEYQQYLGGTHPSVSKAVKFRINCDKLVSLCSRRATVAFEEVHGLDMANRDPGKFLRLKGQLYNFDAELTGFQVPSPVEKREALGETFYQFHAPSRIVIHKPGGIQNLKAIYAMHPTAYEQGGATDGVELSVLFVTPNGKEILIFKRDLSPVEKHSDRGEQSLNMDLPDEEGTLFIKVDPKASAAYDQFIIRNLSVLKRSN